MMTAKLLEASRQYGTQVKTLALAPTTLALQKGELTLLLGPSGSGKTTLLNLLGGLDSPTSGTVEVEGEDLTALDRSALTTFRRHKVGFVFQFFNLVPTLTALENVRVASDLVDGSESDAKARLADVGLAALADRFPSELSGGQQQRVAIARALAKKPHILLADEPTGALDQEAGEQIVSLLRDAARAGTAVVVVTHDEDMVQFADRVIRLRDGKVVSDVRTAERGKAVAS